MVGERAQDMAAVRTSGLDLVCEDARGLHMVILPLPSVCPAADPLLRCVEFVAFFLCLFFLDVLNGTLVRNESVQQQCPVGGRCPLLWGPLPIGSGSVPQKGFVTFWLPAVFSQISVLLFPPVGCDSFQFCSSFLF